MTRRSLVARDSFYRRLAEEFGLPIQRVTDEVLLVHDLGFSTVELFRLSMFLQQLGGEALVEPLKTDTLTVGKLYSEYALSVVTGPQA